MYNKINTAVRFKYTDGDLTTAVIGLFLQEITPRSILRFYNPAQYDALICRLWEGRTDENLCH